ncbi:MAG: amidase, partial [Burkholderiales bacterium]|nr:amidase [Burkholderiales bacterium]
PMTKPYALGLREAAEAIASGAITSEALTRVCLDRIDALEPEVRAWVWLDRERALSAAREADRLHAERGTAGGSRFELLGVPIGVKDIIETRGVPTGMGSAAYDGWVPQRSALLLDLLDATGAFMLGKTVTTEFAFMVPNVTRNPWNPECTPGGSSSGSAAAVASGMVPAALGTQTNGSIIRPAAFCGVVGYKPGFGLLPTEGVLPFSPSFDQPGVFARSVADAALLASSLTWRKGAIRSRIAPLPAPPRLVAVRSPMWDKAERAQRDRFAADIDALRDAGAQVVERELPASFDDVLKVHRTIMLYEAARAGAEVQRHFRDKISDFLNAALDEGAATGEAAYLRAVVQRKKLQTALAKFFEPGDAAILTPPAPGEAPHGLETTGSPVFCTLWTLLATDCISIPTGLGPRGMPLGLQIVGRNGEPDALLSVAAWCESKLPFAGLLVD